jgi:hypothetical protein
VGIFSRGDALRIMLTPDESILAGARQGHGDSLLGFVGERTVNGHRAVANTDVPAPFAGVLVESALRTVPGVCTATIAARP